MTREEFISFLEEELEEIDNALFDETERDKEVNGFYEAYTEPSAAAVSNTLQVVSNSDVKEKGINLMITALQESNGYSQFYIVSLVNEETMETEERQIVETWDEVTQYAVNKWFDVHYQKNKDYEWYYKDGEYWESIIND